MVLSKGWKMEIFNVMVTDTDTGNHSSWETTKSTML